MAGLNGLARLVDELVVEGSGQRDDRGDNERSTRPASRGLAFFQCDSRGLLRIQNANAVLLERLLRSCRVADIPESGEAREGGARARRGALKTARIAAGKKRIPAR